MLSVARPGQAGAAGTTVNVPFRVVDERGAMLLDLVANKEGTRMRLFDGTGRAAAWLSAARQEGSLCLTG